MNAFRIIAGLALTISCSAVLAQSSQTCQTVTNNTLTPIMDSQGPPAMTFSSVEITLAGFVTDVNVVNLTGSHDRFQDLRFDLVAPGGATTVRIMGRSCTGPQNFNLGLDDAAATTWPCPPNDGGTYLPSAPLSAFNGSSASGIWALSIRDQAPDSSGTLNSWRLQVCTAPVLAAADAYSVAEDGLLQEPAPGVLANDQTSGAGPLAADLVSNVNSGSLVLNGDGSFDYAPNADFCGMDSFMYRAVDQTTLEQSADTTVSLTVTCVNDAPVAVDDTYFDDDGIIAVPAPGVLSNDSDVDGDLLTAQLLTGAANGTLMLNADGSFTYSYTGATDLNTVCETDSFTYQAFDAAATGSNEATVTLNFGTPCNRNPVVTTPLLDRTDNEGDPVSFDLNDFFSDPDGDALSYTIGPLPDGISYDAMTNVVSGTLSATSAGVYDVSVTATDPFGGTASDSFTWTVNEFINNDPAIVGGGVPDQLNDEGDVINLDLSAFFSDADGGALTYQATPLPPALMLDSATGIITGTLSDMSAGSYDVTVTVSDGGGGQVMDAFVWTVRDGAGNTQPVATGLPDLITVAGSQVSYEASQGFNDPDDDLLTYSATGLPAGLSINADTGLITGSVTDTTVANYQATIFATDGMSAAVSNPLTIRVVSGGRIFYDGFEGN